MGVVDRFNVTMSGRPVGSAHGCSPTVPACDQHMWSHVAPRFQDEFRVVLSGHIGAGGSDLSAYDPDDYGSLGAYAEDVLTICRELALNNVVFVRHSGSAMIGVFSGRGGT
jgi:sigma-B regulation protein RsbQ